MRKQAQEGRPLPGQLPGLSQVPPLPTQVRASPTCLPEGPSSLLSRGSWRWTPGLPARVQGWLLCPEDLVSVFLGFMASGPGSKPGQRGRPQPPLCMVMTSLLQMGAVSENVGCQTPTPWVPATQPPIEGLASS